MTPEKLMQRALAEGAEIEIDGRVMNAERKQLRAVRPAVAVPVLVIKPEPPTITLHDVRALLDERDAKWQAKFDALRAEIRAPRPVQKRQNQSINFTYEGGVIKSAEITAKGNQT